ncbi:hypothetical protein [Burkholderia stagnalis]|uniref:hypothetical protein n=1 Tax=Burkholderia stagnalis TaxID=1503054 RepID=UPI00075D6D04|nr:hypothetical protein [Burkholderia stagnalis]KVM92295.1 hypothetical protein WT07_02975 [Burkholderia stagnalis]KVN56492.1 hypothetical protein WT14_26920 [Burkholderia stagnalis]KWD93100.1 hypothetical protein WT47_32530 [Burkholderia stagnalis]KWE22243.1 hypothetical protein WT48_06550 [Burkholderia stagnalis]KWO86603.1 hypothetical protein WU00_26970 [Burkholderia stagnalis]
MAALPDAIKVYIVQSPSPDGAVTIHFQESGVGATAPAATQGAAVSNVATAVSNAAAAAIKFSPK